MYSSECQGHGVDEPEALAEALRRSCGLQPQAPAVAPAGAPLPVAPSQAPDVAPAAASAAWERDVRARHQDSQTDMQLDAASVLHAAAEAAPATMDGGEDGGEHTSPRRRRQSASARILREELAATPPAPPPQAADSPEVLSLVAFVSKTSTMAHQASCVILPSCMPVWLSTPPCWISFGASTELYAPIQLVEGSAALGWLSAISAVGPLPRGHSVRGILFQDLPQPTPRKQHAAQLSALLQVKVHWAPVSLKTLSSPLGSLSECGSFPEAFLRSTRLLPFGCASPEPGPIRSRVSVRIYRAGHCLKRLVPDSC